ncbi:SHOCT domain-containing protein [Cellulomonas pakistanensis]|uniref:SHOCT domain-containing protein n=1 Tax=Cellulomonas pakistanensis TaxID=992287 RepID=A0A919P765_9CELL|nr:SHOCT domain-containing protein [Cellulomonas pakistanensis]GIG35565.1 hypothetical protein Cpa01nite_09460 [Cellulomonas pakistanensis]
MPGLLRGVARTAVIAGTASAVSGRVQRRQQGRWAEQDARAAQAQYAPVAAPAGYGPPGYSQEPPYPAVPVGSPAQDAADARIAQLKDLARLRDEGVLTAEEFAAQKARILAT